MTKKKKRNFKYLIGRLHLWLGLASGLIVLLLSVTGCLYAFSVEITNWQRHDEMYVQAISGNRIPVAQLLRQTQHAIGTGKTISSINVYNNPEKATVFICYKAAKEHSVFYFRNIEQYYTIYVNPYTGKIQGIYNEKNDFFNVVKMLHWSLLLDTPIGQPVVGWATFIFVIMLITGIILWWPKNKAMRRQRIWFQWKDGTRWRRKNYDLHNILGFYVSSIALIAAFTGMVYAFTWFKAIVYVAGSGTTTAPSLVHKKSAFLKNSNKDVAFNTACTIAKARHPDANGFQFTLPADSTGVINVYVQQYPDVYYVSHSMQFDQYTGKLLNERLQDEKNFGEKLITANYDIHVGAILGIPGKIMAFTASFICGLLPVTGFLIWRGRKKKKSKKAIS